MDKVKKYTLDYKAQPAVRLLGIVTAMKGYKTAWIINHLLNIGLHRLNGHQPETNMAMYLTGFEHYIYEDVENDIVFRLIKNKIHGGWLFPEIKPIDFILLVSDNIRGDHFQQILHVMRNNGNFEAVAEIDIGRIKKTELLVFE